MATKSLPPEIVKLRQQLEADPAPSTRTRTEQAAMLDVFSFLGGSTSVSARRIPINHRYEMRTDAIIAFAHLLSLISLVTAKWRIRCASAQKAAFVEGALRRIYGRFVLQASESRYFGWQAIVKQWGEMTPGWEYIDRSSGSPVVKPVWDYGDVKALVWEPFVMLRPETVAPAWSADGKFDGIKLGGAGSGPWPFPTVPVLSSLLSQGDDSQVKKVPLENSLWVVNNRDGEFGSTWGSPRTQHVYKYWRAYEATLAVLNTVVQRKGDPPMIVKFPPGSSMWNGVDTPNQTIARLIAQNYRSGTVLTIPSEMYDADEGKSPKWGIEQLKFDDLIDKLQAILSYFDTMKFRAMFISELSVAEGSGGTSSRNVAAVTGVRSDMTQFASQVEIDDVINRYLIPQLCDANLPELRDEPAEKETLAFGDDEAKLAQDILRSIANAAPGSLPVDTKAMLERFNIDVKDPESIVEAEKRIVEDAKRQLPPPMDAKPNAAGVERGTGFYYEAQERITLSSDGEPLTFAAVDEALLKSLPQTKHYADASVVEQMRLVRGLWFDVLGRQYEDFAAYVERGDQEVDDVGLAESDQERRVKKIVDRVMSAWRFDPERISSVVTRTRTALGSIFARAGELEVRRADLSVDDWKPGEEKLAKWVSDNAASLVRRVERTTRKQLSDFLLAEVKSDHNAKQIADGIRAHFAEFPSWRADLIAREETRKFYNAATLFAAESGSGKVQALDARKGSTDRRCELRNGRIFPLEDAWREEAEEHVRGTLAWRILKADLSVQYEPADSQHDAGARCDREKGVVYLREGLPAAAEGEYLVRVGDWLESAP